MTGLSDVEDGEASPQSKWVTYTEDEDGYNLTVKASTGISNKPVKIESGKATIKVDSTDYYANNSTVYLVYNTTDDEYTSYTGMSNVPNIDANGVYGSMVQNASTGRVEYVYLKVASSTISGSNDDVIYIVASSKSDLISDELGEYYEYNALVGGEITTLKVKEDSSVVTTLGTTDDQVVRGVTTNSKGLVTALGSNVYGLQAQVTGTKRVSGGTVGLGTAFYAYADDVAVYRIEDKELVESTINAVRNDTNDTVLYVLDDGVVTDLFITEVDGANQAGQLQSEVSTVIAEFEPASGSGLESVSVSGSTITLEASKDINNSGIVDKLGTELGTLVSQVKSVKISGLNSGNAYNDVMTAAVALKADINSKIPEASAIDKDTVDEDSVKYTVTLTMDDNSTIVYNVEVNWSVVGTKAEA